MTPPVTVNRSAADLVQPSATRVGTQTDRLGECPLWDERLQCLWWVDIRAPALRRWDAAQQTLRTWPLLELVGSIALTEDAGVVLVALRSQLALFDTTHSQFETLVQAHLPQYHRFNDPCRRPTRRGAGVGPHRATRLSRRVVR